jgi:hypothetical protein
VEQPITQKEIMTVQQQKQQQYQQSPLYPFMYALKSNEARRQYPKRLKMLFDYLGIHGSLQEQAIVFLDKTKQNGIQWAPKPVKK